MAGETGDVRFGRSAFGGFNRKDVMEYIDKLQRSAAEKSGAPQAEVSQLERERDALLQENQRLREEITQLRAQLRVEQTVNELQDEKLHGSNADETFSATDEPTSETDAKTLSMRDVDEMVQKYFG